MHIASLECESSWTALASKAAAPVIDEPFSFMEFLLDPNIWVAFFMLTALEIVLENGVLWS